MPATAPYGAWNSPITPAMLAGGQISFWELTSDGVDAYWGEFRASESGRVALMRCRDGRIDEIAPGFNARTLVHEYGGSSLAVDRGRIVASSFEDQRIYRLDGREPRPITPEPPGPRAWRYADTVFSGDRLITVREDHTAEGEARNELVLVDSEGAGQPVVLVTGHDFYASPRVSPDGSRLAWLAWDHPNMPWDQTQLWTADLHGDELSNARRLPSAGESFFQPEWSPDGVLHIVSDRSGWWNLYRVDGDSLEALHRADREFGEPAWLFGFRTYGFLPDGRVVAKAADDGLWSLVIIENGEARPIDLDDRKASSPFLAVAGGRIWTTMGGAAEPMALLSVDPAGSFEVVKRASLTGVDEGYISRPRPIVFPTSDDTVAHGFYYPPTNPDYEAPDGELPPLIVSSHGGPTSQTRAVFNLHVQFWTTRGFAVMDVNYRGSTGYGREYRNALQGRWGDADVVDCVNAARFLAAEGMVDPARLAIRGGSAGGYVTLCALTFHDVFTAGASYCGVADISALMETTHKFESRYDESLIGPMPEARRLAHDRSPIHFADRVSCPVLIIQGAQDPIVTPDQAEVFVDAMRSNNLPHSYLLIEGEDHFLGKAETIIATREAELSFYGQLFGFEPAGEIAPVRIENFG